MEKACGAVFIVKIEYNIVKFHFLMYFSSQINKTVLGAKMISANINYMEIKVLVIQYLIQLKSRKNLAILKLIRI